LNALIQVKQTLFCRLIELDGSHNTGGVMRRGQPCILREIDGTNITIAQARAIIA